MSKFKLCVCFFFIFLLICINYVSAESKRLPLISKVIYIDPGHGGVDSGAFYRGVREADLNLAISKRIMKSLRDDGATVYLTRYDDNDLADSGVYYRKRSDLANRARVINNSGCDLYISIHLNASESETWYGAQVYYDSVNTKNEMIASVFSKELRRYLNTNRAYKHDNTMYLQHRVNRPGILLEVGFLSNPNERYLLQQKKYQKKVAEVVRKSTVNYFSK